jgi:hypothetical protein
MRLPVSKCRFGHTPDKHRTVPPKYASQPIAVKWSSWHGKWVVKDGSARLAAALERGDKWIEAEEI